MVADRARPLEDDGLLLRGIGAAPALPLVLVAPEADHAPERERERPRVEAVGAEPREVDGRVVLPEDGRGVAVGGRVAETGQPPAALVPQGFELRPLAEVLPQLPLAERQLLRRQVAAGARRERGAHRPARPRAGGVGGRVERPGPEEERAGVGRRPFAPPLPEGDLPHPRPRRHAQDVPVAIDEAVGVRRPPVGLGEPQHGIGLDALGHAERVPDDGLQQVPVGDEANPRVRDRVQAQPLACEARVEHGVDVQRLVAAVVHRQPGEVGVLRQPGEQPAHRRVARLLARREPRQLLAQESDVGHVVLEGEDVVRPDGDALGRWLPHLAADGFVPLGGARPEGVGEEGQGGPRFRVVERVGPWGAPRQCLGEFVVAARSLGGQRDRVVDALREVAAWSAAEQVRLQHAVDQEGGRPRERGAEPVRGPPAELVAEEAEEPRLVGVGGEVDHSLASEIDGGVEEAPPRATAQPGRRGSPTARPRCRRPGEPALPTGRRDAPRRGPGGAKGSAPGACAPVPLPRSARWAPRTR